MLAVLNVMATAVVIFECVDKEGDKDSTEPSPVPALGPNEPMLSWFTLVSLHICPIRHSMRFIENLKRARVAS